VLIDYTFLPPIRKRLSRKGRKVAQKGRRNKDRERNNTAEQCKYEKNGKIKQM